MVPAWSLLKELAWLIINIEDRYENYIIMKSKEHSSQRHINIHGLFTSQDCSSGGHCEERRRLPRFARNRLNKLMLLTRNDEITTLSSIARDDVVNYREWAATKQTSLRGA